ncbi:hypothetical protein EV356DRAFT_257268 [Viridothelium virens]|uniref:BTB domain-containing protein n=1 Tax=Viridothelium virens TaxID=1048519 RepID=A0A6A6H2N9_VIRVR|nr:hypothetical protein EV356DRAFT_257268 [Viridothelium virens]
MEASHSDLMRAMATLLEGGKYSDLTVSCGQQKFAVHKAIICSRSGFFEGACNHPFKESTTGVIDLSEDDEECVRHMVDYFYHLDYLNLPKRRTSLNFAHRRISQSRRRRASSSLKLNLSMIEDPLLACAATNPVPQFDPDRPLTPPEDDSESKQLQAPTEFPSSSQSPSDEGEDFEFEPSDPVQATKEPNLVLHAKVYAIADKYDIPGLKALARRKFEVQVAQHWDCAEFPDALEEVYCSTIDTDRGLRDVVLQSFRENPRLAVKAEVEAAVRDLAPLAFELYKVASGLPV